METLRREMNEPKEKKGRGEVYVLQRSRVYVRMVGWHSRC